MWQPIETAPTDGTYFIAACFDYGEPDYEVGRYNPLVHDRFVEAGDGLYRKEPHTISEWHFNNWHRMSHWAPLPKPPA